MAEGREPPCEELDLTKRKPSTISSSSYMFEDRNRGIYTHITQAENVMINGKMTVYMDGSSGRKKKVQPKKPLTNSTDPITRNQMLDIKDKLGRDWKDLARRCGFEESQIEQLHEEYRHDLCELNYQVLLKWQQYKPDDATQKNLAKIFSTMCRGDLADLLWN